MKVHEIMTQRPVCCLPETPLQEVAEMMLENDCGEIPVVDDEQSMRPVGVVTDRDIVCRTIAEGRNPIEMNARECMTRPAITVSTETDLEECLAALKRHQIRRIPVVNAEGACCGIVAQADIAKAAPREKTAELVRQVSQTR